MSDREGVGSWDRGEGRGGCTNEKVVVAGAGHGGGGGGEVVGGGYNRGSSRLRRIEVCCQQGRKTDGLSLLSVCSRILRRQDLVAGD